LARFHFQVRTQSHVAFTEAADLPGLEKARTEAARRVRVLLTEHAQQIWADKDWQMDVTDDRGLILFTSMFQPTSRQPRRAVNARRGCRTQPSAFFGFAIRFNAALKSASFSLAPDSRAASMKWLRYS
jgi:hypothetical protein